MSSAYPEHSKMWMDMEVVAAWLVVFSEEFFEMHCQAHREELLPMVKRDDDVVVVGAASLNLRLFKLIVRLSTKMELDHQLVYPEGH